MSSNQAAGYNSTIGGTAAGVDMAVAPGLTVGAAFGFANQRATAGNAASFNGNAFQFELYGSWRHGIGFVDLQAGGGFAEGTATRPQYAFGARASGNASGAAGGGSLRGGVRLDAGEWRFEPAVALAGVALTQAGLNETQGGAAAMSVAGGSLASVQSVLDIRVERRFVLGGGYAVVPSARLGWLHEYADARATTTASLAGTPGFTVRSSAVGRDAAVLGLRAVLETNSPASAYAGYSGALASGSTVQTVSAGLRLVW